jgi:4-hydroxy-tetrahydrodipicolinate synthase
VKLAGSWVAIPTPFRHGEIDWPALRRIVELQVQAGSDGLVAAGTTGEAATLSHNERAAVIEFVVGAARGRIPVMAGVGTNATRTTVELAQEARRSGASALLVVTPYYVKPTPQGLLAHFGALATQSPLPICLYNIPGRTACDLKPETARELAERHANVVAIKEASGSIERIQTLVRTTRMAVLCGEDHLIADAMLAGATGAIGVVANLFPREVGALIRCLSAGGDAARAPALVERLAPITRALFLETNPAPLKAALEAMGVCASELRLPLVPVELETRTRVVEALKQAGWKSS